MTRGQMIIEYLLITAVAIAAIVGVATAVAWKTLGVTVNEVARVDAIDGD